MKIVFSIIGILLFIFHAVALPTQFVTVIENTNQKLILDVEFPEVEISRGIGSLYALVSIPGLQNSMVENQPSLPHFTTPLLLPSEQFRVKHQIVESKFYPGVTAVPHIVPDENNLPLQNYHSPDLFPTQIVEVKESGIFRDYRVGSLFIVPTQIKNGGIEFYKKIRVEIIFSNVRAIAAGASRPQNSGFREEALFKKYFINGNRMSGVAPAIHNNPAPLSGRSASGANIPPENQAKIIVDRKGIYRITGQDLRDVGFELDDIPPQTLRLKNRGVDIHILIRGDQDGVFDPGDYFEFWGERNEKTFLAQFKDVYADPFSNENVYWLSWGDAPGLRMVEESGAIIETDPTKYNVAPYYPFTVHYEKDNSFVRLGYSNTQHLSHERDIWVFDTGIQAIGKKSYPLDLIYPDSSSFTPVKARLMLLGKSQTKHNVMAWINQKLIGQTNNDWYSQNIYELNNLNNASDIWPANLQDGENNLEIQMPELASGDNADFILFNWMDITYDRQYKVKQNYIEFTRPSPQVVSRPNISLFEFEITNFTRSDIEIYKKGVSKIVNFGLEGQSSGNTQLYKIKFQDDVLSDDVEYMATLSDQKLKPLRIEEEESFEKDNPTLTLRDPSNSAEYLIITHDKFFKRADDILQHRLNSGLAAKMIKVRDIYDEFNFGIKSPLAIQKFLSYAFYNWDQTNRLKYVLFLGDANYNYKTTSLLARDFVPTFFYQTRQFGAVSTDYPYSLIAGDDYLPDIFVGRVPVATNGDVSIYFDKLVDYEQNVEVGPWRNQSLFISGNDVSTYEFNQYIYSAYGIPKEPAFRTQNQRVINTLLPKNFTTFKLNTVKDTTLGGYDPNFGGTTDLVEYLDDGVNFMTFLGHGGGAIWADVSLLNLQDVERLNNKGRYPFVASMTCFTGAFDNPGNPGLAQKLILTRDKGAIGMLASSGLGWVANDYAMLWNFMQELFQNRSTIGEAVSMAKMNYFLTGQYFTGDTLVPGGNWGHTSLRYDMIHQYNLLADPYIALSFPDDTVRLSLDNVNPQQDTSITVTLNAPFSSSEGYLELSNYKNEIVSRSPIFLSGSEYSATLDIPTDFPDGSGQVRAYLSDGTRDAVGVKQIGVNRSAFDSVIVIPAKPNAQDSVSLELIASDNLGIASVKVRAFIIRAGNYGDTLIYDIPTNSLGNNKFKTAGKIPPPNSLQTVYFTVYATNTAGQVSKLNSSYQVTEDRPDPYIYARKTRWLSGSALKIGLSLGNTGQVAANNVIVKLYNSRENFEQDNPFATESANINGRDSLTVGLNFPFSLRVDAYKIYSRLFPENGVDFNPDNNEDSTLLNVRHYRLSPVFGSTYDAVQNDTLRIGETNKFWLSPGGVSEESTIAFFLQANAALLAKSNFSAIPLKGNLQNRVIFVDKGNSAAHYNSDYYFETFLDSAYIDSSAINIDKIRLFNWDPKLNTWIQVSALWNADRHSLIALGKKSGYFAPFISDDVKSPRIELTVEGRHVRAKSLVSLNPVLNIIVEDENGLDLNKEQLMVYIDDIPIAADRIFIPDSVQQSKIIGITAYPELPGGQYDLKIEARDVNGNLATKNYSLKVDDNFDLHVYGNYPNPFSDFTIFSYYLTKELDEFEIRIFTVSGRLIKKIENDENTLTPGNDPKRVGYGELMWDGTDDGGNPVANGVYYAVVVAKFEDEEKREILKVAKLK